MYNSHSSHTPNTPKRKHTEEHDNTQPNKKYIEKQQNPLDKVRIDAG
jgi:hypothetical protein